MSNTKTHMTVEEVIRLKNFLQIAACDVKPSKEKGTCVSGNSIEVEMRKPRQRTNRTVDVFCNMWTQCEQEAALKKMIALAKKEFPKLGHLIKYNAGRMS